MQVADYTCGLIMQAVLQGRRADKAGGLAWQMG
jgi:hypothetical protein